MTRSVTYCHDVPGLIAFKKLLEEPEDLDELLNVVGADDGKGILKMCWNWSKMKTDKGETKLMGPKRSIILAAVADVPETYHNMSVLLELTKLAEVDFILSCDLKLINIFLGLQTFSAKFPCPYGECTVCQQTGTWIKGKVRTFQNISENKRNWLERTNGKRDKKSRDKLKEYKNCENDPLVSTDDPSTPIIVKVPPPPLHTILLGPVNHIIKHLSLHYMDVESVLKAAPLYIIPSNYHGKSYEG